MKVEELIKDEFVRADINEPVSKLIGRLEQANTSEAFIFDGANFVGVFDHEKFSRSKINVEEMKVGNFEKRVPKIKKGASLFEMDYNFVISDSHILPVFDEEDAFIGGVYILDLLKNASELGIDNLDMDAAKRHISPFLEDESVSATMSFMYRNKLREVLVKDKKENVIGVLRHIDLMINYYRHMTPKTEKEKAGMISKGGSVELKNLPIKGFVSSYDVPLFESDLTTKAVLKEMDEKKTTSVFVKMDEDYYVITAKELVTKLVRHNMPYKENIFYAGLEDLDLDEFVKARLQRAASRLGDKLSYFIDEDFELTLHFKKYKKEGTNNKISVNARVTSPKTKAISHRAHDWDAVAATRIAIESLLNQLKKEDKKKGR